MALYPLPLAMASYALGVALLLTIPLVSDSHTMAIVNLIGLAAIGAIGLNILTGYTGQVSLGHGAFMMVGAYTAAILSARYGMPFWVGLPAGGAVAAAVGTFFGIPSLRIKGLYLAIATLAAQFIIEWCINHIPWISGGVQSTIYVPTPAFLGWEINTEYRRYFMILPVFMLAYVAAQNLVRSRVGRAFIAIRDRDVAAEIIGVDVFKYKLLAFAVSSFYAGVAGALWTYYLKIANYEHFILSTSISYLAMVIIGGLGSVLGSVFGATFITLLPIVLVYVVEGIASLFGFTYFAIADFLANLRLIIFGGLIILFLAIEPEGLYRMWGNIKRYFRFWPFSY
ncbi:MAG: branched-chain amino acid ABC transporter permease [Candidatus Rokubacteria bacterium]|nr:branched-chain amino acid ABC transporter permease [Candidatus Rokubacteria bacterium]